MKLELKLAILLSLPLLFAFGCDADKGRDKEVKSVIVISGDNQCAPPNTDCAKELRLELLGAKVPGLLGGEGEPAPVEGVNVSFVPCEGSSLRFSPSECVSRSGGAVSTRVRTGEDVGDQYFKVVPEGFPEAAITLRVLSGVKLVGNRQEAMAGRTLPQPLQVRLEDALARPVKGVPVYFRLTSVPSKKTSAEVYPARTVTDDNGVAEARLKLGDETGTYTVMAEVSGGAKGLNIRGIEFRGMGLNVLMLVVTVVGWLAIFIYGMNLMSDGLQLIAGDKMKRVLGVFTSNRFKAVAAGALVTGVIQSSSACTVMVIGFVNAGLLSLTQAIGVIFGANVGTTMTAQLISFNLGALALPAVVAGLLVMMLSKKSVGKGWGQSILGFGLLFLGMNMMADSLKEVSGFPSFVDFFARFDCTPVDGKMPFLCVLGAIGIGTAMTVLIQSSSATIGIALALAAGGLLNFWTAVPLILGDNIGTTITALLASLGANRRAKQAAVAHTLFNVLGTCYMVALFYVPWDGVPIFLRFINSITAGDVFAPAPENISRHIAMAHTMFNVCNVIVFIGFIPQIAKLCGLIVKIKDEAAVKLTQLEPHLLNTPSVAIEQSIAALRHMTKEAWAMVDEAMTGLFLASKQDAELVKSLAEREKRVDAVQQEVTEYLAQLTQRVLTEPQSEIIPLLMHCVNDAERVADHTENIAKLSQRLKAAKHDLSKEGRQELDELWGVLAVQADNVIASLNEAGGDNLDLALKDEKRVNRLADKFEKNHIKRLRKCKCDVVSGIVFIEMLNELEKVGDHLANIAERAPQIQRHHLNLS